MDTKNYITLHRKGQHLLPEERCKIEVRRKDGRSVCRIAKHLERPYNTNKNEIARETLYLYRGNTRKTAGTADDSISVFQHRPSSSICLSCT